MSHRENYEHVRMIVETDFLGRLEMTESQGPKLLPSGHSVMEIIGSFEHYGSLEKVLKTHSDLTYAEIKTMFTFFQRLLETPMAREWREKYTP